MKLKLKLKKITTSEHETIVNVDNIKSVDEAANHYLNDPKKHPVVWTNAQETISVLSITTLKE